MRVRLSKNKEKYLLRGYPWVFANQIDRIDGEPASGDVVEITASNGAVLGLGLYHAESLIAVRFLTSDPARSIDASFFRERLENALDLRERIFDGETHVRLAFGESDGLPGTVIDRYGDVVAWSNLSFGMELRREWLFDALEEMLAPAAIVERNDSSLREKDGLEQRVGVLRGAYDGTVEIREADVVFDVDVLHGPKTGFFIDQRDHRRVLRRFVRDLRVLDVFSADGGFGLHAAVAGARHVWLMDNSARTLERARHNAERNGVLDRVSLVEADALERLGEMADAGESFDLIILDPPGFAKSRRQVDQALKAYQRINITSLQMLPPGGILATSSCSQAVSEADFLKAIDYSARRSGSRLRTLFRGFQPADHPVLPSMPETHYLKFFIFQKIADELPRVDG